VLPPNLAIKQLTDLKAGLDVVDDEGRVLYRNQDLTLPPRHSRSYAYCSDTGFTDSFIPYIRDVDLLYNEATFMVDEESKARETLHCTARDAAGIAKAAGARRLLLGHFSARYKDLDPLLQEARDVFPETELATEGETYVIPE
jgi:ribonuclease Z